jgi:hypothetical protein
MSFSATTLEDPHLMDRTPARPRVRSTHAFLALLTLVVVFLTACAPPFPPDDPFYRPPSPLPAGDPGDVISSRTSRYTTDPLTKAPVPNVSSWQVMYRSTDALGQAMPVTGTVLVPTTPWNGPGSRPLVSYAVGTRGVGDQCAPSYTLTQGADYEGGFIKGALDRGFAVAVSDYQGLGTPGGHTYMVGPAQGHAVLDVARAATRLPGTGLSANTPIGLMGYSQGGGGAGWAAQLESTYAPELNIKGTAIGGVPGDLTATAEFLNGSTFVAFALMTAIGFDSAYPELDLVTYLNERGVELAQTALDMCLVDVDGFATLINTAFTRIEDYVTTNPLDTAAWQQRLNENKLGATKPAAPVYQSHGLIDEIVPFQQAADLRRTWCDQGANVTWSVQLAEHLLGLVGYQTPSLDFLGARFANTPVTSNCSLP